MASTMLIVAVVIFVVGMHVATEARSQPGAVRPSERCPTLDELRCVNTECPNKFKTPLYIKLQNGRQCKGCDVCNLDKSGDGCPPRSCTWEGSYCEQRPGQTSGWFDQYFWKGADECNTCPAFACMQVYFFE